MQKTGGVGFILFAFIEYPKYDALFL